MNPFHRRYQTGTEITAPMFLLTVYTPISFGGILKLRTSSHVYRTAASKAPRRRAVIPGGVIVATSGRGVIIIVAVWEGTPVKLRITHNLKTHFGFSFGLRPKFIDFSTGRSPDFEFRPTIGLVHEPSIRLLYRANH